MSKQSELDYQALDDLCLAKRFSQRDPKAVELVVSRNNQRLFRSAWSIVKNRSEAEDVVQAAYLKAFTNISSYEGKSSLTTWLTRIVINEALERRRTAQRRVDTLEQNSIVALQEYRDRLMNGSTNFEEPENATARNQIRQLLEQAIARLPEEFRVVFVLREIEQMSISEVAGVLGIPEATVKTRGHRARRKLQSDLVTEVENALTGAFPFAGADCEAMAARVLKQICDIEPIND